MFLTRFLLGLVLQCTCTPQKYSYVFEMLKYWCQFILILLKSKREKCIIQGVRMLQKPFLFWLYWMTLEVAMMQISNCLLLDWLWPKDLQGFNINLFIKTCGSILRMIFIVNGQYALYNIKTFNKKWRIW